MKLKLLQIIKSIVKKFTIQSEDLIKTISANGLLIFFKIVTSFIVSKVTAFYLGPAGYALVGNFKNVLQGVLGITATGFESGSIKYISESKSDSVQVKYVLSNILVLNLSLCSVVFFVFIGFSSSLSVYILKDVGYAYIFKYLAFLLPLISLSFISVYVLNGLQKLKVYTILLCLFNLLNAIVTFLFVYFFGVEGALLSSLIVPSLSFLSVFFFSGIRLLYVEAFRGIMFVSLKVLKNISTYLVMAIYSSLLLSLSYLFIRNAIIKELNLTEAGYWEALNKISVFYMIFFTSLFTLYLLPKLSLNKTMVGYISIMNSYFKIVIPLTIVSFVVVFILKYLMIKWFLSDEFLPISKYLYLQLFADFFKIIAFSLAYQFHAKKMLFSYMVTDSVLYISFYFLSVWLLPKFQLFGVLYAYLISVVLYLILVSVSLFVFRKKHLKSYD